MISLSSAVALESIPKLLLLSQREQRLPIEQFADQTLMEHLSTSLRLWCPDHRLGHAKWQTGPGSRNLHRGSPYSAAICRSQLRFVRRTLGALIRSRLDPEPRGIKRGKKKQDQRRADCRAAEQDTGHRAQKGVCERDERQHGGKCGQDHWPRALHRGFDDSVVVVEACCTVSLICSVRCCPSASTATNCRSTSDPASALLLECKFGGSVPRTGATTLRACSIERPIRSTSSLGYRCKSRHMAPSLGARNTKLRTRSPQIRVRTGDRSIKRELHRSSQMPPGLIVSSVHGDASIAVPPSATQQAYRASGSVPRLQREIGPLSHSGDFVRVQIQPFRAPIFVVRCVSRNARVNARRRDFLRAQRQPARLPLVLRRGIDRKSARYSSIAPAASLVRQQTAVINSI